MKDSDPGTGQPGVRQLVFGLSAEKVRELGIETDLPAVLICWACQTGGGSGSVCVAERPATDAERRHPTRRCLSGEGRLGQLLRLLGISAGAFAEKVGRSPATISAMRKDDGRITRHVAEAAEAAFGVDPAWLMFGRGDPPDFSAAPAWPRRAGP